MPLAPYVRRDILARKKAEAAELELKGAILSIFK
jgi:hypothetical protein